MAATIYLHWTATGYDWIRPGHYHRIIGGDGRVHRLHALTADLPAHTWRRNSNSIALACACMGGQPDPWTLPPTAAQLHSLCQEVAGIARSWGWTAADITIQSVMTHAEAASNRDGRWMHDNYGPVIWGGTGERWDLLQLEQHGTSDGGEQLRQRIAALLNGDELAPPASDRLAFRGVTSIEARGQELSVQIDADGRSWALMVDLLQRYDLAADWDGDQRRVLIAASDVAPTYRDDAVQAAVGWPLVEMALQGGQAPGILTGILRPSSEGGSRLVPGDGVRRGIRHQRQL